MDKLNSTGLDQGRVFNSRSGRMHAMHFPCSEAKRPSLKLKPRASQLSGYLPSAFALPRRAYESNLYKYACVCLEREREREGRSMEGNSARQVVQFKSEPQRKEKENNNISVFCAAF